MAEKKNYHTIRYGNKDGELKFGHIHDDENISAFMVRSGYNSLHYITMDATGDSDRKNSTINRSPGPYEIKAGDDVKEDAKAIYIEAVNGDIVLSALNGRVSIQAKNIDLISRGGDNKNGNITLDSNEKISLLSKNIECNATSVAKFFSSGTVEVVGDSILNIYGGLIDACDGATKLNQSKAGGSSVETREASKSF
jgi:hypothetical protein